MVAMWRDKGEISNRSYSCRGGNEWGIEGTIPEGQKIVELTRRVDGWTRRRIHLESCISPKDFFSFRCIIANFGYLVPPASAGIEIGRSGLSSGSS